MLVNKDKTVFLAIDGEIELQPEMLEKIQKAINQAINLLETRHEIDGIKYVWPPQHADQAAVTFAELIDAWEGTIKIQIVAEFCADEEFNEDDEFDGHDE